MAVQDFDGPFQMDAARAFDENDVAGAKVFDEPLACGLGVVEKDRRDSAGACSRGKVLGVALHCDDEIEAGLGRDAPTGNVEGGTLLA